MNIPKRVTIELTNRCNRQCKGCPSLKTDYPLGNMSLDLYKKILNQLPSETIIVPFFRGESLAHPDFVEMMNLLKRFDKVQIATNGDLLTPDNQNAMLNACTFISYSLHNFEYPEEIIEVVNFLGLARKNGVITQASILENLITEDYTLFIEKWLKHIDRVRIYVEHSTIGYGDVKTHYKNIGPSELLPCKKVENDLVIYWNGKVALCNHDWNSKTPLGDLNTQTIEEVWNGERYQEIRKLHKSGSLKQIETCKDCDYWMTDYLPNKMFGELYVEPV